MTDWDPLLDHLASAPRENGTPALDETAAWLTTTMQQLGLAVESVTWTAHPWRLRIAGMVALAIGVGYALLLARKHARSALAVALVGPALLVVWLDVGVPLLDFAGGVPQQHVVAHLPASGTATGRLVFSAHYDTKTDLLDHLVRAPLTFATVPCSLLMIVAAFAAWRGRWPKLVPVACGAALFSGLSYFLVSTGGAFVPNRSPGAIDDGAGCAVVIAIAQQLKASPLAHTDVDFIFFSGEEIGVEGSRAFVRSGKGVAGTRVINLDGVGATADLAVFKSESALLVSYPPDAALLEAVSAAHLERRGKPVHRTFYSAVTDARAFLEAGIPAVTLASDLPGHAIQRRLHSAEDRRALIDPAALDETVGLLLAVARRLDR
ncbi:MAG: putative aminopeptidase [Myxococcaceae bacterium]|nr:putative aminopeptidase [Myxococcaceae bacterium]